jgi:O-succinylbenzoate synthase
MKTHALLFSSTEAGLGINAKKKGAIELGYNIVKGTEQILLLKTRVILNWCCSKRGVW